MPSKPPRALIGSTGFVGNNLASQMDFDEYFNSRNIHEIEGQHFSQVTIAAAQAKKWWANINPSEDWAGIEQLLIHLARARFDEAVLISTIDVLHLSGEMDEDSDPDPRQLTAYGKHRLRLERELNSLVENAVILRLPGLFGTGLKKNVIFDLMSENDLHLVNPQSSYQYYDLQRLSGDIQTACSEKLRLVHLFSEPIHTHELITRFFPGAVVGEEASKEAHYDHRTKHGTRFGGDDRYIASKDEVFEQIERFLEAQSAHPE